MTRIYASVDAGRALNPVAINRPIRPHWGSLPWFGLGSVEMLKTLYLREFRWCLNWWVGRDSNPGPMP